MPPLDPVPDIEERAAIVQYDGGLSRRKAEDAAHYRQVLADYVVSGRLK